MHRVGYLLVLLALAAGCASPQPASTPPAPSEGAPTSPPPAAAEAEPSTPPVETGGTADTGAEAAPTAPAAPRMAPDRWWHMATLEGGVPSAHIDEAHALLAGRTPAREVVVAVIDGGVDLQHEDLDDVLWVNADEVPGNGVDDDGNGYVDDVHGWNFIGGPDGRNVEFDTFEMTRIHAACTGGAAAGPMPSPEPGVCARAAEAYEAEHLELTGIREQIVQLQEIYPVLVEILSAALGQAPTVENVTALEAFDPRTSQARDIYLQLSAAGIDEEMLEEQAEEVESRLTYGLDLDFDPRPVVGDDYADASQRVYGNPDVEGPDPSHGTAVASVIGAERGNGLGIDGAADGVRLMAIRTVPNGDERDKDVANAIRYAVDNGAHVINMSFGKDFSPYQGVVDEAIRYADEAGVLMVHASGNDGEDLARASNFPSARPSDGPVAGLWIEVGASGWSTADSLAASFSNYGAQQVDLFAPGVAILSAAPDNEYEPADGTSLAAPVVSGIAALLMAYFPSLDAADVRRILLETATAAGDQVVARPGGEDTVRFGELSVTGGVVNAAEAVRRAQAEAPRSH